MRAKGLGRWVTARRAVVLSALAWVVVSTIVAAGCSSRQPSKAAAPGGVLRAGIAPDFPPLCFKQDGTIKGIEADFATKLGERGLKVNLTPMAFGELIPALTEGRIDVIMSGMSITERRIQLVDFTVPYMRVGQMALVRKADYDRLRVRDAMDRTTSRVGVIRNTTGEKYARSHLSQAQLVPFDTVDAAVAALRHKQIDFFINDAPIIWSLTSPLAHNTDLMGLYRPLTNEYIAWAVRRGEAGDALREQLNDALLTWQENGQLEAVLDRWVTVRKVTLETR